MGQTIQRFGDTWAGATVLSNYEASHPIGTDRAASPLVRVPGGARYDAMGTDRAPGEPGNLELRGRLISTSVAQLQIDLDAIKALLGKRSKLWSSDGGTQRWRWARLLEVVGEIRPGIMTWHELRLVFDCLEVGWYGQPAIVPETLDTSPKTVVCANGGNRGITNPVITVSVPGGGTAITSITIAIAAASEFTYTGTIAAGTSLVIDCGARSVKNNGVSDYAHFALHATNHVINPWLQFNPGNNSVIVTIVGGGVNSTISFAYDDGWE